MPFNTHNEPHLYKHRVKILHSHSLDDYIPKIRQRATQWLYDVGANYEAASSDSVLYYWLYIQDPNHMLLFKLKFPEIIGDHLGDHEGCIYGSNHNLTIE